MPGWHCSRHCLTQRWHSHSNHRLQNHSHVFQCCQRSDTRAWDSFQEITDFVDDNDFWHVIFDGLHLQQNCPGHHVTRHHVGSATRAAHANASWHSNNESQRKADSVQAPMVAIPSQQLQSRIASGAARSRRGRIATAIMHTHCYHQCPSGIM